MIYFIQYTWVISIIKLLLHLEFCNDKSLIIPYKWKILYNYNNKINLLLKNLYLTYTSKPGYQTIFYIRI